MCVSDIPVSGTKCQHLVSLGIVWCERYYKQLTILLKLSKCKKERKKEKKKEKEGLIVTFVEEIREKVHFFGTCMSIC